MAKVKKLKQATISSLKGVVVYEDLLRHKMLLETENQDTETLLESLLHMSQKKPCKEALVVTDICKTVKSLCCHSDSSVSHKAQELLGLWQGNTKPEDCQPTLEVRYDLKTQHYRNTAIRYFTEEIGNTEADRRLAYALEKELFHVSSRLVSGSYRRTARKIIFVLKHNSQEKDLLKSHKISPTAFVRKYKK